MPVVVRSTGSRDVPAIDALCSALYRRQPGTSILLETSLLCLTAVDTEQDAVVGFLCLHDGPTIRFGCDYSTDTLDWLKNAPAAQSNPSNTAYIWVLAVAPQYEVSTSAALLRTATGVIPSLRRLLLATSLDINTRETGLASIISQVAVNKEAGVILYEADRQELLPPLAIRLARVEDHDDMLPVQERADSRYPALAKLPESSRPQEAFALTRVVSGQDERNVVLVAHSGSKLVGFMVATTEVDTTSLLDAFDLHAYDCFLPEDVYETQSAIARERVHLKQRNTRRAKLGDGEDRAQRSDATTQADADGEGEADQGERKMTDELDGPLLCMAPGTEPAEWEVRAELAMMLGNMPDLQPSVLAITMACVEPLYEAAQALDFIRQAFESFPDTTYCLLTLPHDSPEPPMVAAFTRVDPVPGASFPEVLYVFNRHALIEDFVVRLAVNGDAEGVSLLVAGMSNAPDVEELFQAAVKRGTAVVATVSQQVVALVTISDSVDVSLLESNFTLSQLLYLPHHQPDQHGEMDMVCVNPIFAHRMRELLSGTQRMLRKTVLYYALPPGQATPDVLEVMMQVPPRRHAPPAGQEAEFALYLFARRHAFTARQGVNARVVVVGASETGLATVERLLLDTELSFNYITLLAPGGIPVEGMTCQYTRAMMSKLGLDARVTVLDAELVGLDRESHIVELSDGAQLAYDLLLVTTGKQEQTCNVMAADNAAIAGHILNASELAQSMSLSDALTMETILVYGNSLETYQALATLEKFDALEKTLFFAPHGPVPPLVQVLTQCAADMSIELLQPEHMTLRSVKLLEDSGTMKPTASLVGDDLVQRKDFPVDLVVGCQLPQVSQVVFLCLNNNSIVFDGRVVVDGAFRTSDPQIYAAGTVAKLSREFGHNVHFNQYNSREVGTALGESVVSSFKGMQTPQKPAELGQGPARVVGCQVPRGLTFMYSGTAQAMAKPGLTPPASGGQVLHTTSSRGSMYLILDHQQCVHAVAYLGIIPLQVHKMSSLVGLHINYLQGLLEKYEAGAVSCLVTFLTNPAWAELLQHEHFSTFRQQLLVQSMDGVTEGQPPDAVLSAAQEAALEWVRSRLSELPGFVLPVH